MAQFLSHQNRYLSQNEIFPLDRKIIGCPVLWALASGGMPDNGNAED